MSGEPLIRARAAWRASSVTLPFWTHQAEEIPQGSPVGKPVSDEDNQALVDELRQLFMHDLDANRFEAIDDTGHAFAAYWG